MYSNILIITMDLLYPKPANISLVFLYIGSFSCYECTGNSHHIPDVIVLCSYFSHKCRHCRAIKKRYFKSVIEHLDKFDIGSFSGGAIKIKLSMLKIDSNIMDLFYESNSFSWFSVMLDYGTILNMILKFSIEFQYFELPKKLIMDLLMNGVIIKNIDIDSHLFKVDELKWLIFNDINISADKLYGFFDMEDLCYITESFEKKMELLEYIKRNNNSLKINESVLSRWMKNHVSFENKKSIFTWFVKNGDFEQIPKGYEMYVN
jgi:hypothetical protein